MIDRKLRYTLSAVAWVATLFWCLALFSTALAAAQPRGVTASSAPHATIGAQ